MSVVPEINAGNEPAAFAFNGTDLKDALRDNHELFMHFYLGEQLTFDIPEFHLVTFKSMVDQSVKQSAYALPRGHNKTTLAKLAVVHHFLYTDYSFIVYVSNTAEVAQAACRDIVAFLQSQNHAATFGSLISKETWREGEGLYIFKMLDAYGKEKTCILRALGAGQQVRGLNIENKRPELGVVDDLEDDDNTSTPTLIAKLRNWVYGAFFKAFNRWKKKIIWLGNMLSTDSLLYHYCQSPDWHSMLFGCLLSNGEPLWPDLWPLEAIRQDFKEYKALNLIKRWFAEMMNMPMPPGSGLIDPDRIGYRPYVLPGDSKVGFVTIDPAITANTWSNEAAFVAHLWIDDAWQIVEVIHEKLVDPIAIINIAMDMAERWGLRVIGCESVAFQASMQPLFKYIFLERNKPYMVIHPIPGGVQNKTAKLAAWAALLSNGTYFLSEGDIECTKQLLEYNPTKTNNKDDVIDACSMGVYMINHYLADIMQSFALDEFPVIQTAYQTSGV